MNTKIDDHIIEGLIGLGYDLHIFDRDGIYPDGADRDTFEKQEIAKLINAPQQDGNDFKCKSCGTVRLDSEACCR